MASRAGQEELILQQADRSANSDEQRKGPRSDIETSAVRSSTIDAAGFESIRLTLCVPSVALTESQKYSVHYSTTRTLVHFFPRDTGTC